MVQKLRAPDPLLAQGVPIRSAVEKIGIATQSYHQPEPPDDGPHKNAQPNALKEIAKSMARRPAVSPSQKFSVRRDESWEMFGLFMDAILADLAVTRMGPPSDLPRKISPKLARALFYLAQHGGCATTVGELADGVGVSLGWASRVADELVSIGLLERIRNEHDRRVVQLQLTPGATAINGRLWNDREGAITTALSEVSPEERPVIARFLRKLATELETQASKAPVRS
jgi:DNA-binding MarR family transcriptional regulator